MKSNFLHVLLFVVLSGGIAQAQESPVQQMERAFELYKQASFDKWMEAYYAPQEDFLQHSLTIYGKPDSLMSADERLAIENMRLMLEKIYLSAMDKSHHELVVDSKINWSAVQDFTIDVGETKTENRTTVYYPKVFFNSGGRRYAWKPGKFMITGDGSLKCVDSIVKVERV